MILRSWVCHMIALSFLQRCGCQYNDYVYQKPLAGSKVQNAQNQRMQYENYGSQSVELDRNTASSDEQESSDEHQSSRRMKKCKCYCDECDVNPKACCVDFCEKCPRSRSNTIAPMPNGPPPLVGLRRRRKPLMVVPYAVPVMIFPIKTVSKNSTLNGTKIVKKNVTTRRKGSGENISVEDINETLAAENETTDLPPTENASAEIEPEGENTEMAEPESNLRYLYDEFLPDEKEIPPDESPDGILQVPAEYDTPDKAYLMPVNQIAPDEMQYLPSKNGKEEYTFRRTIIEMPHEAQLHRNNDYAPGETMIHPEETKHINNPNLRRFTPYYIPRHYPVHHDTQLVPKDYDIQDNRTRLFPEISEEIVSNAPQVNMRRDYYLRDHNLRPVYIKTHYNNPVLRQEYHKMDEEPPLRPNKNIQHIEDQQTNYRHAIIENYRDMLQVKSTTHSATTFKTTKQETPILNKSPNLEKKPNNELNKNPYSNYLNNYYIK